MTPEAYALLLMLVGFALIVAEVFVPSGGMILILCVIAFVSSIWFAHKAWWSESQHLFWVYLATLLVLIPTAAITAFRFLENSTYGRRVLLAAPSPDEVVPLQAEVSRLAALIGRRGKALTLMTPGGMVSVDGERLHALSEGTLISPQSDIEVIGVKGPRVIVREVGSVWLAEGGEGAETGPRPDDRPAAAPDGAPLDFDYPHG